LKISRGDLVILTCIGNTHTGKVRLCSPDRMSLTVRLHNDGLKSPAGGYARIVPLLMRDSAYHELISGKPVEIAVIQRAGSTKYIELDRRD
jgi:hypothetical protein